jgi:diguanylate cyclase (GGDEF)-like protein/PAS domain S-box-containing protein
VALRHAPDLLVVVDAELCAVWASSAVTRVLGHGAGEMVGTPIHDHVHPDDLGQAVGALGEATRNDGYHMATRLRIRRNDGSYRDTRVTATTFESVGGTWMVLSIRPVEDEIAIEQRRAQLKALAQTVYLTCAGMHWYQEQEQVVPMLGTLAAVVGARAVELASADEKHGAMILRSAWAGSERAGPRLTPGTSFWAVAPHDELRMVPCVLSRRPIDGDLSCPRLAEEVVVELWLEPDDGPPGVLRMTFDEVSPDWDDANADVLALMASTLVATMRRCNQEQRVNEEATRDPLTRLLNRGALLEQLSNLMDRSRPGYLPPVVLFADLNNFKALNDTYGHREGDRVLQTVADAIRNVVRGHDLAARVGGDEFVVAFDAPAETAGELVARIRSAVDRAIGNWPGLSIAVGAISVGPYGTPTDVLDRADLAMYRDKKQAARTAGRGDEAGPSYLRQIGEER